MSKTLLREFVRQSLLLEADPEDIAVPQPTELPPMLASGAETAVPKIIPVDKLRDSSDEFARFIEETLQASKDYYISIAKFLNDPENQDHFSKAIDGYQNMVTVDTTHIPLIVDLLKKASEIDKKASMGIPLGVMLTCAKIDDTWDTINNALLPAGLKKVRDFLIEIFNMIIWCAQRVENYTQDALTAAIIDVFQRAKRATEEAAEDTQEFVFPTNESRLSLMQLLEADPSGIPPLPTLKPGGRPVLFGADGKPVTSPAPAPAPEPAPEPAPPQRANVRAGKGVKVTKPPGFKPKKAWLHRRALSYIGKMLEGSKWVRSLISALTRFFAGTSEAVAAGTFEALSATIAEWFIGLGSSLIDLLPLVLFIIGFIAWNLVVIILLISFYDWAGGPWGMMFVQTLEQETGVDVANLMKSTVKGDLAVGSINKIAEHLDYFGDDDVANPLKSIANSLSADKITDAGINSLLDKLITACNDSLQKRGTGGESFVVKPPSQGVPR